ncbi:uncharacterized protein LAJ45_00615 [Morchella importuna]|uniref:uncharacterized protein n=1 Tax=Morchella importuna TaxID=1174673 RepID=UPI001E8EB48C|nr:uncharacterized protein LAJ45_00615 [Morchella importuna]KAH8155605.1 hypothetical protein LAJ45_00615 [Morchella importuna]
MTRSGSAPHAGSRRDPPPFVDGGSKAQRSRPYHTIQFVFCRHRPIIITFLLLLLPAPSLPHPRRAYQTTSPGGSENLE